MTWRTRYDNNLKGCRATCHRDGRYGVAHHQTNIRSIHEKLLNVKRFAQNIQINCDSQHSKYPCVKRVWPIESIANATSSLLAVPKEDHSTYTNGCAVRSLLSFASDHSSCQADQTGRTSLSADCSDIGGIGVSMPGCHMWPVSDRTTDFPALGRLQLR